MLSRYQFPIKPDFAITIHKAQGQTFDYVGVNLTREVFSHGQLYVASFRVRRQSALKVLLSADRQSNQAKKNRGPSHPPKRRPVRRHDELRRRHENRLRRDERLRHAVKDPKEEKSYL
uniref:Uncharacterized protein n=1 Tax=Acrobeloides nanus TaxID=290746 RepID=A0A914CJM0_9BILA